MSTMMEYDVIPPCVSDDSDPKSLLSELRKVRNCVIGSNRQKKAVMKMMIVPRLLSFMENDLLPFEAKTEAAIVLGSLAKGPVTVVQELVDAKIIPILLKGIVARNSPVPYVEACLRCLRSILSTVKDLSHVIYEDSSVIQLFISILQTSVDTQECISTIFAHCCVTPEHQTILADQGVVLPLVFLMATNNYRVQMAALRALSAVCYRNLAVSTSILACCVSEVSVLETLERFQERDKMTEMQMAAAKCLTYIYRAGALNSDNPVISHKTLPTLVRMCNPDKTWEERVEGAETLGYLIEVDVQLQSIAAISDHIISTLAEYFKYPGSPPDAALMPTKKDDIIVGNDLRQAAFRAYASLCANSEEVRKKVIETDSIMKHIVNGLTDPVTKVQVAAIRCLHSLSRSVQVLRTSFADHNVWKSIVKTLYTSTDETVISITTGVMCNLLLEFSPNKEPILDECDVVDDGSGMVERKPVIIDKLLLLTRSGNMSIRLNAVWALMNMTFQANDSVKNTIIKCLKNDDLFHLVSCSEPSPDICLKTLCTLRNLVSKETVSTNALLSHVDRVMESVGHQIMESVILVLESGSIVKVKEQALYILSNLANGTPTKHFIMENNDVLRKILNYLTANDVKLQLASLCCVYNLVRHADEEHQERNKKLKEEMGLLQVLEQIKSDTTNSALLNGISKVLEELSEPESPSFS